ncbi:MAG: restriction endonuclease subunit S, partial [Alphaproteobacteria bacterium]|nr:restriction endonuclease subunit S [Alphaproteobacteria bacterium]
KFKNGDSQYKTKAEIAKALYIDEITLNKFPATFNENGIPTGWEEKKIESLIDNIKTGKRYEKKTSNYRGKIPVLDQGKNGFIGYHNNEAGVEASFEKPVATFANHTCYRRLIYYPFSTIQNIFVYYGKGVSTTWLHYMSLGAIKFSEYKGHMPEFKSKKAIVPNNDLTNTYEEFIFPWLHQIWNNQQEIKTLTKTRDTLLPQLITGKIRV